MEHVNHQDSMNLAALPADTRLFQLLTACGLDHEIALIECNDGAMIMECMDCPFYRSLDDREEACLRAHETNILLEDVSL
jgi:hypothetical protein